MQQMTTPDGACLAYLVETPTEKPNRHEPILLIHGFASSHAVNWVFPQWVQTLTGDGRDTILYDVRGHGRSEKFYDPAAYALDVLSADALALIDHLGLARVDVMGYSMGARIAATLQRRAPDRVRSLVIGGLGANLFSGETLPLGIADAMDAPALESLTDPHQRMFPRLRRCDPQRSACARRLHPRLPPAHAGGRGVADRVPRADRGRHHRRRRRRSRRPGGAHPPCASGAHRGPRSQQGRRGPSLQGGRACLPRRSPMTPLYEST